MNTNEPDKFEQFMGSVRETGEAIGAGFEWLGQNAQMVALVLAVPTLVLAGSLIMSIRWWRPKRNSEVSGMRHARRR